MRWLRRAQRAHSRGIAITFGAAVLVMSGDASAVRIAVRGSAVVEARASGDGDAVVLKGVVRDDVGLAVAAASLQLSRSDGGLLPNARGCNDGAAPKLAQGTYTIETDAIGAFCVRVPGLARTGAIRVWYAGSPNLAASGVEVSLEPSSSVPSLAWDARPDVIDLDAARLSLVVRATAADEGHPVQDVPLGLFDGPKQIGTARVGADSLASFDVATSEIDGPEVADIEVRSLDPHVKITPLKARAARMARVALVGAGPASPVIARDGFTIDVAATTSRGKCASGTVEAVVGGEPVGVGTVSQGRASVKIAFDVGEPGNVRMDLRYLPASAALRPGAPLTLNVPVRMPPIWRSLPLFLLGALVLAWMARGWRRAPPEAVVAAKELEPVRAEIVREAPLSADEKGWRGVVLDAHERTPLAGANVSVVTRDFVGERRLAQATTATDGTFVLDIKLPWSAAHVLVIEGPLHAKMSQTLPRPGRLSVALVSRRRALIERLVAMASAAGGSWLPSTGDPTPGHVISAANGAQRHDVAQWARSVEGAAFGPTPVDDRVEAEVTSLETDLRGNRPPAAGRR